MSIVSEITRLQSDSAAIAAAIAEKGVTVPAGSGFDDYATLIGNISTGGGGITPVVDSISQAGTSSTSITFAGLRGTPKMFAVQCGAYPGTDGASISANTNRCITSVICNGNDVYSTCVYRSGSTAYEYIYTTCTFSYSNGSLTITSPGANTAGAFRSGNYKLFYIY